MPQRIRMTRQPGGWRAGHPDAVIVARPTMWGNPWRMGTPGTFWLPGYPTADPLIGCAIDAADAVTLYRHLLTGGPDPRNSCLPADLSARGRRWTRALLREHATAILRDLPTLRGRDLACWCPLDCHCHADVLLEIANR